MAKYNEGTIAGETWTRAFQIIVSNEYEQAPVIRYDEEDMILLAGDKVIRNRTGQNLTFTLDPSEATTQFQLRNPVTDEYIEQTATYQDMYVLLHSLYFHLANIRDRGPKPQLSWVWNESTQQWEAPVPQPYPSWLWNESIQDWYAPVEKPAEGNWEWNESTLQWSEVI